MLDLISKLLYNLDIENISYCHWKSNANIMRSASGETDLDLLVDRKDVQKFTEILYRLNFKAAYSLSSDKQVPGILDYYGYDLTSGKLIHVHAHYQLILGHDAAKNYRLAVEKPFLVSSIYCDRFRIPIPEFEYVVLVIRLVLKHSTVDAILGKQGLISLSEQQELDYLQKRIDPDKMQAILKENFPLISEDLFMNCLKSLQPKATVWNRIKTGYELQSVLEITARQSQLANTFTKLERRIKSIVCRKITKRLQKKRLMSGGAVIAIIGGDGAGKTTAINDLYKWLSKDFDAVKYHIGKPSRSIFTFTIDALLKIGYELGKYLNLGWSKRQKSNEGKYSMIQLLRLARYVFVARDRFHIYMKAQRRSLNGEIVICDRWHLPINKQSETPQIRRELGETKNPLIKVMMNIEESYYSHMRMPDLLFVLRVDPEIAVKRRKEDDSAAIRLRCQAILEADWSQITAHVIDANNQKEDVLSQIKSMVWSFL